MTSLDSSAIRRGRRVVTTAADHPEDIQRIIRLADADECPLVVPIPRDPPGLFALGERSLPIRTQLGVVLEPDEVLRADVNVDINKRASGTAVCIRLRRLAVAAGNQENQLKHFGRDFTPLGGVPGLLLLERLHAQIRVYGAAVEGRPVPTVPRVADFFVPVALADVGSEQSQADQAEALAAFKTSLPSTRTVEAFVDENTPRFVADAIETRRARAKEESMGLLGSIDVGDLFKSGVGTLQDVAASAQSVSQSIGTIRESFGGSAPAAAAGGGVRFVTNPNTGLPQAIPANATLAQETINLPGIDALSGAACGDPRFLALHGALVPGKSMSIRQAAFGIRNLNPGKQGEEIWWSPRGKPVLFSGDLATVRRVDRVVRRTARSLGLTVHRRGTVRSRFRRGRR